MIVWTIQPLRVYQQLLKEGHFRCDPKLSVMIHEFEFGKAYDWMSQQMEKRIGRKPDGVKYPIWVWHTMAWQHRKPDLRRTEFRYYDEDMACIELNIPDSDILLSDEENWHFVLNDLYFNCARNEREYNEAEERYESLTETEQQKIKEKSWEIIFDIEPFENDRYLKGRYIQATFWEIRAEHIVSVRTFKGWSKK